MRRQPRKAVIKNAPRAIQPSLTGLFNELRGKYHRHFCSNRDCRLFYEDACETPETNHLCQGCRGLRRSYSEAMDPRECCIGNCEQVTDRGHLEAYKLAGPGPWFRCRTCARTHGWPCT